ncbi:ABC transporter ATP-binding protein [Terasakiella sp.]|uniref:ABC transporter ATP-binding protein n=1 Tax=Terasakiella sp. TaxID=2034861 RepID=UPI003AA92D90
MNDLLIDVQALTKTYRLFDKPSDRMWEMLRLWGKPKNARFHVALNKVSFSVQKGERISIIGRNGAGKSTLLRLISGATNPTSGKITVNSAVQALLQIGAGFHPEFTGRQNAEAYLAQMGVPSAQIAEMLLDIVEFAELEEYIDQPLKTYSSGMVSRLGFSAATVVKPDLLILDEVLSVGDAYFARKSQERIEELSTGSGTTLLFVTHDIYSAQKMCPRMLWLDNGAIRMDGTSKDVAAAYEKAIKEREEQRLDRKRLAILKKNLSQKSKPLVCNIKLSEEKIADDQFLLFEAIRFYDSKNELHQMSFLHELDENGNGINLHTDYGSWGEEAEQDDRKGRILEGHGSVFLQAPFSISSEQVLPPLEEEELYVEVSLYAKQEETMKITVLHPDGRRQYSGMIECSAGWNSVSVRLTHGHSGLQNEQKLSSERYGNRSIEITNVEFQNENGDACHVFSPGDPLKIKLHYRVNRNDIDEKPIFVFGFQRPDNVRSHRFFCKDIHIGPNQPKSGVIEVQTDKLLLGAGDYFVTTAIFKEGYFTSAEALKHYTTNKGVYDSHPKAYEIKVAQSLEEPLFNDVIFIHDANWSLCSEETET